MRKLQQKLAETEAQMTKILSAMQMVQSKVGETAQQPAASQKLETQSNNESNNHTVEEKSQKEKVHLIKTFKAFTH